MPAPLYPRLNNIWDLQAIYGLGYTKQAQTLRQLGYTETEVSFPAFTFFWRQKGWPLAEMLDLTLMDAAWNDALWASDTYWGAGLYIRPNFVSQSRAWIVCPDGKYRIRYGCPTALGRYSGKHAQISSDAQGTMPGGTCLEIDHAGWSVRQPERICMPATVWGKDYSEVGGLAYQEGVVIENFRFRGMRQEAGAFNGFSAAVTLNEPGENSVIRYCMAEEFKGPAYVIFNGTPGVIDTCSAFENDGPGFDLLGSNGLCNVRIETPSGDNNKGGLIRIRPKDAQSVGGGTIVINNLKSESRGVSQVPIVIEGRMGDLNLVINGMTADFIGTTAPHLIGGNWTGTQYEVNANGIDLRAGVSALFRQGNTVLTGGKAYSGNSFIVNDEGLAFRSRSNMVLTGGAAPPPPPPGPTPPPPPPPPPGPTPGTLTATAFATGTETGVLREARFMVDGQSGTFWISGRSMTGDGSQWVVLDRGSVRPTSSVSFGTGAYVNSFPRSFSVETSVDGSTWTTRSTQSSGAVNATASWPAVDARYVRIRCTAANSNWWAIAEAAVA